MTFQYFSKETIEKLTNSRTGETKIGDKITLAKDLARLENKIVLIGIAEDIGILANLGRKGAKESFMAFLPFFLNMQHTPLIEPNFDKFVLGGQLKFPELEAKIVENTSLNSLRKYTEEIDQSVTKVIEQLAMNGNFPIVIGGGHNNSFGLINGFRNALKNPIDVLNIDPHFDFRALEGRHSGNGFSYAYHFGALKKYLVWGYHPAYNHSQMTQLFNYDQNLKAISFDDLLLENNLLESFSIALDFLGDKIGLEIDLDSVAGMGASAYTPSGFSENDIRRFLKKTLQYKKLHYLHLAEGAPSLSVYPNQVGKFLAYLVFDCLATEFLVSS